MRAVRQRGFRAFTLTEVLIAASLSAVFAAVAGSALIQTTERVNTTVARSSAETTSRQALETLSSALKGARPLAACDFPSSVTPFDKCTKVTEGNAAFIDASPTSMTFYSYAADTAGALALRAPDRVVVTARPVSQSDSRALLSVSVYPPNAGATYTTAQAKGWSAVPSQSVTVGVVEPGSPVFEYFDAEGNALTALALDGTSSEKTAQLAKVALVVARPRIQWTDGSDSGLVLPRVVIPIPSKLYAGGQA